MLESGPRDAGRTVGELGLMLAVRAVLGSASHGAGVRHGCEVMEAGRASLSIAL